VKKFGKREFLRLSLHPLSRERAGDARSLNEILEREVLEIAEKSFEKSLKKFGG